MKELSIEEKAYDGNYKAHTELINRLEDVKDAIKKQNYGIAMDILCKPYPQFQVITHSELKESEDERIRQFLIQQVTETSDEIMSYRNMNKENVLAWLEKQGESKPIGKLQLSEELYEHIRNTCACIDDALSSETLADINDYLSMAEHSAKSAFDMIEKQGEQKPADVRTIGYWHVEDIEQKPAWSEEDEKKLETILYYIKSSDYNGKRLSYSEFELTDWLKSLKGRVQPKQEWSEEDDITRKALINLVEMFYGGCIDKSEKNRLLSWLKSLSPHWKSSDEQIEALDSATENCAYSEYQYCLRKLLKQLKKLREE